MIEKDPLNEEIENIKVDFEIPVEGSLGLLAFGHIGLILWRNKRREVGKHKKNLKSFRATDDEE